MNKISSSVLLDILLTFFCVCVVDSFLPELRTFVEKHFHGLFSKKKGSKSGGVPSFLS